MIFSWVQTPALPNAEFVGLQSFPRELWLEPTTQRLHSKPIDELTTLYKGAGKNSSVQFAKKVARQTSVLPSLIGQHCFNLRLHFTFGGAAQPPVAVAGSATGVTLFDGGGQAAGLTVALAQPACADSSELVQSDLIGGNELASLSPPADVAANATAATKWCHTQCCARQACFGWTSILNASAAVSSCRLKGSGAVVVTLGGGGCLASTMGTDQPDGSGDWRCVSGLRGLELHVDGGGPAVPVYPKASGEIALNILADKMIAEVFVDDARGEGAAAMTAVYGGVCAKCSGASLFAESSATVSINAHAFVVADARLKSDDGGGGRLPRWNTTIPDGNKPLAGLELLAGAATQTVHHANLATGTYNHGAELAEQDGALIAAWTNGQTNEDAPGERVVFSVLPVAGGGGPGPWTAAQPLFERFTPTAPVGADGVLVSADEFLHVNGRLYARASVFVCTKCGAPGLSRHLAGHLLRRVVQVYPVQLGPLAWMASSYRGIPAGAGHNISLYTASPDVQLREDTESYLASVQISMATPTPPGNVGLNEYSVYQRRAPTVATITQLQLVMLIRCRTIKYLWGSVCNLYLAGENATTPAYGDSAALCNWSMPVPTDIPDSHSLTSSGTLPDGQTFLLGTQVNNTHSRHARDPLTLSLSMDGVSFDRVWAVRAGAPDIRFPGSSKDYGFAYPNAMVYQGKLMVVYSSNKENIELVSIDLEVLRPR